MIAETSKEVRFSTIRGIRSILVFPMKLIARIPHGGYVPGQIIHIEIRKKHDSSDTISKFKVEFVRVRTRYE